MEVLLRVERMMENATRALAGTPGTQQGAVLRTPDAVASAARGN
jgi:hypothetical protein